MKILTVSLVLFFFTSRSQTWQPAGDGLTGYGMSLGTFSNQLYAGGSFTDSSNPTFCLAQFQSPTWVPKAHGILPPDYDVITAIQQYNNELYIAGVFWFINGFTMHFNISKWTGSAWSPLGTGVDTTAVIFDLEVFNNKLYAAGTFTTAGGINCSGIASWDGSTWAAVGGTASLGNGYGRALQVFNGELYVCGTFTSAGGVACNNIAKWNGSVWQPVGLGLDGLERTCMTIHNNELYVGGYIVLAGGSPANNIAKWDGSGWSAVGSGTDQPAIMSLASYSNQLYASGEFTSICGVPAKNTAKWNGAAWSQAAGGLENDSNTFVSTLLPYAGNLYATGHFNKSGTTSLNNIARLGPAVVSALAEDEIFSVRVYPNPVSDFIYLTKNTENTDVTLINILGEYRTVRIAGERIDVRDFSPGVYSVIIHERDNIYTQKIVISH